MRVEQLSGTCDDCRNPDFDMAEGCGDCINTRRKFSPCVCGCIEMGFTACATVDRVENCSCTDGTADPNLVPIITGGWVGWDDPAVGQTLLQIAALQCPGNPHTYWRLYGSIYDFGTHATITDLNCATAETANLVPIDINGSAVGVDLAASPIVRDGDGNCIGGGTQIFPDIRIIPTPGGTGTDCTQEGGYEILVMEVRDGCDNVMVECEFEGVMGNNFSCDIYTFCCKWDIDTPGTEGGGGIFIHAVLRDNCECIPTTTITIDPGGSRETVYVLDPDDSPLSFLHFVTPFTPGETIDVLVTTVYDCAECLSLNGMPQTFHVVLT